ncbi:MAG: diacylglycerol kinase family lipid kinase [Saprospiraceae bacterium]
MAERRWLFVVNPVAGNWKVKQAWPQIEKRLEAAGVDFSFRWTEGPGHATELVREAIAAGYRNFVAVGGDGTGNEVANGMLGQEEVPADELLFTLLPIGTGNDWVRQNKIPNKISDWIHFFRNGRMARQDAGWVQYCASEGEQKRFFINVMGLGYDGYVAKAAAAEGGKVASKLSYLLLVFRCMFSYRTPGMHIRFDGQELEAKTYAVVAGINKYSGGGFQLVPHAQPNDGQLALTIARRLSKIEVLLLSPLFYTGWINWHPAISLHDATTVSVNPLNGGEVLVETDGEFLGKAPARIGIVPEALRIWVT